MQFFLLSRDLMESVNKLYDNLNSTMVKLVHIADNRLSKLEHCLQLREFEEECTKVSMNEQNCTFEADEIFMKNFIVRFQLFPLPLPN